MKLTKKLLLELELSLRITLTPEQRAIMLYWYGYEGKRECWDEDDFIYGIRDVRYHYPDHRPKATTFPDYTRKTTIPDGEPF